MKRILGHARSSILGESSLEALRKALAGTSIEEQMRKFGIGDAFKDQMRAAGVGDTLKDHMRAAGNLREFGERCSPPQIRLVLASTSLSDSTD
jgi:hypothetical protein